MKISIFGLGYVGSVSAAVLADMGHHVIGVDPNQMKVAMINQGQALIVEPELAEMTKEAVQKQMLRATTEAKEAVLGSELTFVCVGTPSQKDHSLDLQYVKQVSQAIGDALKDKQEHHVIAYRSTMLPGSMRQIVIPILEAASQKKAHQDFSVCFNPEFMMESTAVHDFKHPPKNVIGTDDQVAIDMLTQLNRACTNMDTIVMDLEGAELIKYCDNIWHALKVGFANEIGKMCKTLKIDSHQVMEVFCQDTKLNLSPYYLKPGFAFGGSCLPKDLRAFLFAAKKLNIDLPIINAVLPSNQLHINEALDMIIHQGNKKIGILGFSFKANTDDLRESPTVELIERLIGKGYELTLFDKNVATAKLIGANRDYILKHIPHISELMVDSIEEVLHRSNTIVIGNNAQEFAQVVTNIKDEHVIIDLVRIQKTPPQSSQYHGICW
ncbi:MAG: UDP-glucose/GDP-mannose dehydrogenase family protein [Gammaproteobacteria bacterium]|nr:UDP-glucose/GDP-mannose dehydrogenase family protein [Gammaproteobacteria bacterium]